MPMIFDESMQQRLKQAEMAERELARLQPLAQEAEELRLKQAQAAKFADSLRRKDQAIAEAQQLVEAAGARQVEVADLLNEASQSVSLLFAAMKDGATNGVVPPRPSPSLTALTTKLSLLKLAKKRSQGTAIPADWPMPLPLATAK